jgi:hypothetical protein
VFFLLASDFVYTLAPRWRARAAPDEEETVVPDVSPASRSSTLTRALCAVILVAMVVTVVYAAWIGTLNFSRIGV